MIKTDKILFYYFSGNLEKAVNVTIQVQHKQLLEVTPNAFELIPMMVENRTIRMVGHAPGHSEVECKVEPSDVLE